MDISEDTYNLLDKIDNIFVYIYLVEVVFKIIGLGIKNYFRDNWNKLDFSLLFIAILSNAAVSIVRFFRTARATKVAKSARSLKISRTMRVGKSVKSIRVSILSLNIST